MPVLQWEAKPRKAEKQHIWELGFCIPDQTTLHSLSAAVQAHAAIAVSVCS